MKATTIKIENPLLKELKNYVGKGESLSAFIRKVLELDIKRRKIIQAADDYAQFLEANPNESQWMEEWASADLTKVPKVSKGIKKK